MNYFVETMNGWTRIDYPCYGPLSELHDLGQYYWSSTLQFWDEDACDWFDYNHSGSGFLEGFRSEDIVAVYTHNVSGLKEIPDHPMFKHIEIVIDPDFPHRDGGSYFKLTMAEVPCDELFIPMFMLRNIFADGDSDGTMYWDLINDGVKPFPALIFANLWYKSRRFDYAAGVSESVYYPNFEDGGTMGNCKVGDVVAIMSGTLPNFTNSVWGSLARGYPSYGVSEEWDGDDKYEPIHPVMNRAAHMSDCTVLKRSYKGFLDTRVCNDGSFFTKEELNDFIKEIMKHVEGN